MAMQLSSHSCPTDINFSCIIGNNDACRAVDENSLYGNCAESFEVIVLTFGSDILTPSFSMAEVQYRIASVVKYWYIQSVSAITCLDVKAFLLHIVTFPTFRTFCTSPFPIRHFSSTITHT